MLQCREHKTELTRVGPSVLTRDELAQARIAREQDEAIHRQSTVDTLTAYIQCNRMLREETQLRLSEIADTVRRDVAGSLSLWSDRQVYAAQVEQLNLQRMRDMNQGDELVEQPDTSTSREKKKEKDKTTGQQKESNKKK